MDIQHRIKHTLGQPGNLEQICHKLQEGHIKNRSALANRVPPVKVREPAVSLG